MQQWTLSSGSVRRTSRQSPVKIVSSCIGINSFEKWMSQPLIENYAIKICNISMKCLLSTAARCIMFIEK